MATVEIKLRVANAIGEVSAEAWDACANPGAATPAGNGDGRRLHLKTRL